MNYKKLLLLLALPVYATAMDTAMSNSTISSLLEQLALIASQQQPMVEHPDSPAKTKVSVRVTNKYPQKRTLSKFSFISENTTERENTVVTNRAPQGPQTLLKPVALTSVIAQRMPIAIPTAESPIQKQQRLAREHNNQLTQLLLQKAVHPDALCYQGKTALMLAAECNNIEAAQILISLGANVNHTCAEESPLDLALKNNHIPMAEFLRSKGARSSLSAKIKVPVAQRGMKSSAIAKLFEKNQKKQADFGSDSEALSTRKKPRLHSHSVDKADINLNLKAAHEVEPLRAIELIADTQLQLADQTVDHEPLARIPHLIPDTSSFHGTQPAETTPVQRLIQLIADSRPYFSNEQMENMPHEPLTDRMEIEDVMIGSPSYDLQDSEMTESENEALVRLTGAINERNYDKVYSLIAENNSHLNTPDERGWTPLMHAISNNDIRMIHALLRCGADINARSRSGISPLHFACSLNKLDSVSTLLFKNADVTLVDEQGKTAFDYAREKEDKKMGAHLIQLLTDTAKKQENTQHSSGYKNNKRKNKSDSKSSTAKKQKITKKQH